jgi:AcrR family transcriptional regulator
MSPIAKTRSRISATARRELIDEAASKLFAERGYHATSIDEIAKRSGVSPPVVYDHFVSKQDLYKRLLERHLEELLQLWRQELAGEDPAEQRVRRALEAWFEYIESHPAWLLVFRDAPPELRDFHRELRAQGLASLVPLMAQEPGAENIAGSADPDAIAMATELFRSAVAGVALWWYEHRHVPREQAIATIMNVLWIGVERLRRGERWKP